MINNDADFSTWIERGEIHSSSRSVEAETMGRRWHQRPGNEQVAVTEGQDSIFSNLFPAAVFTHVPAARGSEAWWGTDMRQFEVGEVVTCCVRYSASGSYKIVALMPDQDGEYMYRIKSPLEEYERVVKENTLAWSEDVLPDEPSQQRRVGRRNITLPTLVPWVAPSLATEWDLETAAEADAQAETGAEFSMGTL